MTLEYADKALKALGIFATIGAITMDEQKTVSELIQAVADEICDRYCKYPDTWNEEKEGCELSDSEICANCPLSRL